MMDADNHNQSSDDEVFIGQITDRERKHPSFNSRRRTTLYLPGIARPDSNVSIYEEVTDDGTLIFCCEEGMHTEKEASGKTATNTGTLRNSGNYNDVGSWSEGNESIQKRFSKSVEISPNQISISGDVNQGYTNVMNFVPSVDRSSEASDTDSGFNSSVDAGLRCTSASPLSLISPKCFSQISQNAECTASFLLEDRKRKHSQICHNIHSPSLHSLINTLKSDQARFKCGSHTRRHTSCLAESMPAAAIINIHDTEKALSNLKLKSPKDNSPPAIKFTTVSKDFSPCPEYNSRDKCIGEISASGDSNNETPLMKRKIAKSSPLGTEDGIKKREQKKPEIECTNLDQVLSPLIVSKSPIPSGGKITGLFDRKPGRNIMQKLDDELDDKPNAGRFEKEVSTKCRAMCDGAVAYDIKRTQSGVRHAFVSGENRSFTSVLQNLDLAFSGNSVQPKAEDKCELVLSQGTENNTAPSAGVNKDLTFPLALVDSSLTHSVSSTQARPPLLTTPHSHQMNQSTLLRSDLFITPFLHKSDQNDQTTDCAQSPVPSSDLSVTNFHLLSESLQPVQDCSTEFSDTNLSASITTKPKNPAPASGQQRKYITPPKYPPRKKHKRTKSRVWNKENEEEEPHSSSTNLPQLLEQRNLSVLEEYSQATMTRINTLINGETRHSQLDPASSPALLMDFPPPKEATRISWSDMLSEEPDEIKTQPPLWSTVTPRSILQQRPEDHKFPFSSDPPSPIVLTRRRAPKVSRIFSFDD